MPGLQQFDWSKIWAESDNKLQNQFTQNLNSLSAQPDKEMAKIQKQLDRKGQWIKSAKSASKDAGFKLKTSSGKIFNNIKSSLPDLATAAGTALDVFTQSKTDPNDSEAGLQNQVRSDLSNKLIASSNPIAMAVGIGSKVMDAIGAQTGLNLDNIDKEAGKAAGVKGGLNNAINYLPGVSILFGAASKETTDADAISDEVEDISGAYSDSYNDLTAAQKLGGKRIFGRKKRNKINSFIDETNETNQKMYDISTTNTYRKQSDYGNDLMQQNLNRYAGSNWMNNAIGEHGMKLMSVEQAKYILSMRKAEKESLQTFEDGGKINIIPEGARHSRLNHLDDVNDDFEDVTKKGIPVVTPTEGGDLEQVAEIERTELVINLDLTNEVEELRRKWKETKDEKYLIEAGKLLAEDVVTNTFDPGNQVEEFLCPQN